MKDFLRNNGVLILIIAVLLSLIVAVSSALLGGFADPFSNLLGVLTTPIRSGINSVVTWAEDRYTAMFRQSELEAEYVQLKKDYAQLEQTLREAQQAIEENERYRNLLGLKEARPELEFTEATVTATVTAVGATNWDSTLTISQGSSAGLEVNQAVIDEYGNLVGLIDEVGANWARVMTVIDSDLELGGLVARTDSTALLEGNFELMAQGKLRLSYLPENSEFMTGDQVLTSGLSGLYPAGLVVGYIEEVRTDPSGMTRYAVVTPEADLQNLRQVFVITNFAATQ